MVEHPHKITLYSCKATKIPQMWFTFPEFTLSLVPLGSGFAFFTLPSVALTPYFVPPKGVLLLDRYGLQNI